MGSLNLWYLNVAFDEASASIRLTLLALRDLTPPPFINLFPYKL